VQAYWDFPIVGWIKVNTKGVARGPPGPAACVGIFRVIRGEYIGGFSTFFKESKCLVS